MKEEKIRIGLVNPKSPENVGSVMRAAGNFRVGGVFFTGERYNKAISCKPNSANLSRKVGQNIPLSGVDSLMENIPDEMKVVCVEFAENAIPLPEYEHPENAFYIFGPEDGSLGQQVINRADAVVYVPTVGCMNLAATVNVVLYDRLVKSTKRIEGNALIFKSRDNNNSLRV